MGLSATCLRKGERHLEDEEHAVVDDHAVVLSVQLFGRLRRLVHRDRESFGHGSYVARAGVRR